MPLCLLAPLPCEHVADSMKAVYRTGVVALATGDMEKDDGGVYMFNFFRRIEELGLMGRLPVFIQVSLSGQKEPAQYFVGQKVSISGVLLSYEAANDAGRHPNPLERPDSALATDRRSSAFWRIGDFKFLERDNHLALSSFKTAVKSGTSIEPGKKIDYILRGPILAFTN